jgi:hypothetical protein
MPYDPHALFGPLVAGDLDEYNDTGAVNTAFSFTTRMEKVEKRRHVAATTGTALTSVTCTNAGDTFTKSSHGLLTGQPVTAEDFSAGFTDGTYYVIKVDSSTFKLASSPNNAYAGTAVAVSDDGTGGVVTPITLASYRQIGQVQVFYLGAEIEQKIQPIPTSAGAFTGLALVGPGEHLSLANFQAGAEIHRMNNDATKLLMVGEVKQDRSVENPAEITIPSTYYPQIAAPT